MWSIKNFRNEAMSSKKDKRLRIAMVIDVFDEPNGGGILSTQRFVEQLRKRHSVLVVSTGREMPGKAVLPSFYLPFVRRVMERMKFIFAWPSTKVLRKAFEGADLVHVQLPFLLAIRSITIAGEMGVPVVASFHVQPENICYNIGIRSRTVINWMYRFFIKMVYNRSSVVVCPSPFAEKELKRRGLSVPGIVVSNGILPQFRPAKASRDARFRGKFMILTVGRLAKDKRHDVLIEAVSRSKYRDVIQLVCPGQGPIKDRLEELGSRLPNPPVFGWITEKELIRFLNTADLYVHPSEVELESMSVLEAMGCGLPPIISNSGTSAAKRFALTENFLFRCNDPADLTAKIDYWVEHRAELKKARAEYLKRASHFRMENSVRKLEEIYYGVVGDRSEEKR
jgi:glycosyltransferase involved in cell wall biosynthesis